jgi:hypothetical protein
MAKSKFQQAQEDYPMVASALNKFPPTRVAMGIGNVIDQASQDNASGVKDALLGIAPYGKAIGKAINGDLAGAAEDIALSKAPPLAKKAYNYFAADNQDPNTVPVEDRSTYSPEVQAERAATDATYYSDYGGGVDNKGMDTRESSDYKRGGKVKAYAKGGAVSKKPVKSTRGRGDGIAQRGHTKGRII